ncbi:hypothetical protein [Mesorhizobium sp. LjNodule214]|uniref:hypothetical protein n=1 Tax=Mesorhizobium sp. LjNodule214 TaxID=3342252 RepID=UPI003F505958
MSNVIRFPSRKPPVLASCFRVEIWQDEQCFMVTVFDCGDPVRSTAFVTYQDALAAAHRYEALDLAEVIDKVGGAI